MDVKTLLGDQYKEGMTLAEIDVALKDKELVDKSTLPASIEKTVFDKTASELADAKRKLKDFETKNLSSEEQLKRLQDETALSQKTFTTELSKLAAKELFLSAGIKETDFAGLMSVVVKDDVESTKAATMLFVNALSTQKTELEKTIKADLLKSTSTPPNGTGGTELEALDKKIIEAGEAGKSAEQVALIRKKNELLSKK